MLSRSIRLTRSIVHSQLGSNNKKPVYNSLIKRYAHNNSSDDIELITWADSKGKVFRKETPNRYEIDDDDIEHDSDDTEIHQELSDYERTDRRNYIRKQYLQVADHEEKLSFNELVERASSIVMGNELVRGM